MKSKNNFKSRNTTIRSTKSYGAAGATALKLSHERKLAREKESSPSAEMRAMTAEEDGMAHTGLVVEARAVRQQRMHQNYISGTKQQLQWLDS